METRILNGALDHNESEESPTHRQRGFDGAALLPAAATLANLVCGCVALLCGMLEMRGGAVHAGWPLQSTFPSFIAIGAGLLLLAMFFDALDGRLARLMRRTSEIGAQLDSLADVVSFGAAPAMLYLAILLRPTDLVASRAGWDLGLLTSISFSCCAALRLARFNAENVHGSQSHENFSGLPSPAGAAFMVGLLLVYEDLRAAGWINHANGGIRAGQFGIGVACIIAGVLMVSRLRYPHFGRALARIRTVGWSAGILALTTLSLAVIHLPSAVLIFAMIYLLSGPMVHLRRSAIPVQPEPSPPETSASRS